MRDCVLPASPGCTSCFTAYRPKILRVACLLTTCAVVMRVQFTADGQHLVCGSVDGLVEVYDFETGLVDKRIDFQAKVWGNAHNLTCLPLLFNMVFFHSKPFNCWVLVRLLPVTRTPISITMTSRASITSTVTARVSIVVSSRRRSTSCAVTLCLPWPAAKTRSYWPPDARTARSK